MRFLTGTDEHAAKNVQTAHAAGEDVAGFVAGNAAAFRDLAERSKSRTTTSCGRVPTNATGRRSRRSGAVRGGGGSLSPEIRRVVLRGLRGVLRSTPARRPLRRARQRARSRRRGELVLPALPLPRHARRVDHDRGVRIEPEARRNEVLGFLAGDVPRHQRFASPGSGARLGHSRSRRSRPDRLRVVRRADQLHQRARLRR